MRVRLQSETKVIMTNFILDQLPTRAGGVEEASLALCCCCVDFHLQTSGASCFCPKLLHLPPEEPRRRGGICRREMIANYNLLSSHFFAHRWISSTLLSLGNISQQNSTDTKPQCYRHTLEIIGAFW